MSRMALLSSIFVLILSGCTPAVIPLPDFTATPAATTVPTLAPATVAPTETSLPTKTPVPNSAAFTLTSLVFDNNGPIPTKYTCAGPDISPALAWNEPPARTVSFVLIVDDPDAVSVAGMVWDHWVLFNLSAETRALDEGAPAPKGSLEGVSSGKRIGYEGPCPPGGSSHHYNFTLYALDIKLGLKAGVTKKAVLAAMGGHVLAQAKLVGLYPFK
jgi:Raf kinase inhibitor-like YbhB/YbcL family protein